MWEQHIALPFGRVSIRKFLMLAATVLVAAFAYVLVSAPTAHAQSADASWQGDSIVYNGNTYQKLSQQDADAAIESGNLPTGAAIYQYLAGGKAQLIYFNDGTDPPQATAANFVTYDYNASTGQYTNPSGDQTITMTPDPNAPVEETTSCVYDGIGWIICPLSDFMAEAMDWLFGILAEFLAVRPVQTNQDNSLFRAWSIMRDFANVAFVIGFMIIIYSQLSNFGLSNYGIKRTLPRLVIAAILVNVSYWICAIAIDLSNIIGYSLQDIFMAMRDQITGTDNNSWDVISWSSVTTAILSGGTAAAAGVTALVAVGSVAGALYLLLPVLVGVLIAALVAIIIMAARQALITILVILAPLAFVAYLLPNTEKYYERWQGTFITMLVLFPIFAVLFGGSQLAGTAIIQNADSIIMLILGMAVQIAPLVILPFLIKFSGSLLGNIAGMVNNKSKGLIDRTRGFAQGQADAKKAEILSRNNLRKRNVLSRAVQSTDTRRRKREGWQKANEAMTDANWANTEEYRKIHEASARAGMRNQIGESLAEKHVEDLKRKDAGMQRLDLNARLTKLDLDDSTKKVEATWEEVRAGKSQSLVVPENLSVSALANFRSTQNRIVDDAQRLSREATLTDIRKKSAEEARSEQLTQDLLKNNIQIDGKNLREYAGGVMGETGAQSVLANTVSTFRKEHEDRVKEQIQLLSHFNPDGGQRQDIAIGARSITKTDANGNTHTFDLGNEFAQEAAIEMQLSGQANVKQMEEIFAASGTTLSEFKTTISKAIPSNKLAEKAAYLSGKTIDDIAQGKIQSSADLDLVTLRSIAQGKVKPSQLATMDQAAIQRIRDVVFNPVPPSNEHTRTLFSDDDRAALQFQIQELAKSANDALTLPSLKGSVAQNVEPLLREIVNNVPPTPPPHPLPPANP